MQTLPGTSRGQRYVGLFILVSQNLFTVLLMGPHKYCFINRMEDSI